MSRRRKKNSFGLLHTVIDLIAAVTGRVAAFFGDPKIKYAFGPDSAKKIRREVERRDKRNV